MYTLQQRIRPSSSAFICTIWLNDQTLATANLQALHALQNHQALLSCSFDGAEAGTWNENL